MDLNLTRVKNLVKDLHWHAPVRPDDGKPVVILLHGLGGDRNDWMGPFQERNWPYDHNRTPGARDMGVHEKPPLAGLPGLPTTEFLSPRIENNTRGLDGSDDRSWWNVLVKAGFPVFTYSQVGDLMVPFSRGPVAQFTQFMELLQQDVLSDPVYITRQVVILGHSRGGLIARAFLGNPDFASGRVGVFPRVKGLITLSSPHQGSHMALVDDKLIGVLSKIQSVVPTLPNDVINKAIEQLKVKIDDYVGPHGDEIEPGSRLYQNLEAQEPIRTQMRFISVGGTSPRLLRLYLWAYAPGSMIPKKDAGGKLKFHWEAKPMEVKGASPIPDGLPLKLLGMDVDEILPGRGDGLTADKRCRFPATFKTEEHLSVSLSHAEELWNPDLQAAIIKRLETFK